MPHDFFPLDQVLYMPPHAEHDVSHPDCEQAFVTSATEDWIYIRCFFKKEPAVLRTVSTSETVSPEFLIHYYHRDQSKIDKLYGLLYDDLQTQKDARKARQQNGN